MHISNIADYTIHIHLRKRARCNFLHLCQTEQEKNAKFTTLTPKIPKHNPSSITSAM